MSRALSPSAKRSYGIARVCRAWEMARSTVYETLKRRLEPVGPSRKRGPRGAGTDEELTDHIRRVLAESPWIGEGHRKVWAMLRHQEIRPGRDRVLRLMREAELLAPQRTGHRHGPKAHDGSIIPDEPDVLWGTDMTTTLTGEGNASIFILLDHCTTECLGIHAARPGTRYEALEPVHQAVRERWGEVEEGVAAGIGLALRHDHGSQYVSDVFQSGLRFLGIYSSPSFVREPEGNGCAERFIRTLKEQLLWIRRFETVEELRLALHEFRERFNRQWMIERHGYRSPSQYRADLLDTMAAA